MFFSPFSSLSNCFCFISRSFSLDRVSHIHRAFVSSALHCFRFEESRGDGKEAHGQRVAKLYQR